MAMNKLSYGSFDASNTDIAFASTSGYTNPTSELETRKQLSYPLKELKTFINNTVSVDGDDNAIQLVVDDGEIKYRTEPNGALIDLDFDTMLATKQDTLVSGTNIKTVEGSTILTSGNIRLFPAMDVTNLVYSTTSWINTSPYYKATEDGYAVVTYTGYNVILKVGGAIVCQSNANSSSEATFWFPVRKNQTIQCYQTGNHSGTSLVSFNFYGKQGM